MDGMDPFEARLLFGNMLENLSGSQATIDRAVAFALRSAEMADDLFECVSEKLEKLHVPPRLNVLLVVDGILGGRGGAAGPAWHDLVCKDVVRLVQAVVPETPGGDSNVAQTRKVAAGWRRRGVFDAATLDRIDRLLEARAGAGGGGGGAPAAAETGMRNQDILKRIEEDRERHKRHKEDAWIRPAYEPPERELAACWDAASDFGDADWAEIAVDAEEHRRDCRPLAA
ncbi:hypothetical protein H4R18_003569 [Coemansia javaensis]|uniref:CID domain-containing protein n=1 Tax=Coemansia javaensis TaxID=2761396 RepID=A0A9W8HEA0_9FUNG|nr:hypothetical protein H4R18_003569 [Coemansia javaensis]